MTTISSHGSMVCIRRINPAVVCRTWSIRNYLSNVELYEVRILFSASGETDFPLSRYSCARFEATSKPWMLLSFRCCYRVHSLLKTILINCLSRHEEHAHCSQAGNNAVFRCQYGFSRQFCTASSAVLEPPKTSSGKAYCTQSLHGI